MGNLFPLLLRSGRAWQEGSPAAGRPAVLGRENRRPPLTFFGVLPAVFGPLPGCENHRPADSLPAAGSGVDKN